MVNGCSRRKLQGLLLVLDLECALDKNLVERKGRQGVDRQQSGGPRSTFVHHEFERYVCAYAQTGDIGGPCDRRGILVHAGTGYLASDVHCIHRELTATWP